MNDSLIMVRSLEGKHPLYYEAILQLREVSQEVIDFVTQEIKRVKMPITKISKEKNGWDYYVIDNQFTKSLGKKLQQKFGGQLLTTASLHTQLKGKEVYRVTVLFRGVDYKKNDAVTYHGEEYVVTGLAKNISLQHVKTKKKVHLRYTEAKRIKLL